ncbi:nucleotide exchange factor GrpE, partial [Escherichia coli]|nr:nucleotide exchange factor GrpE [Escherichia coli]
KDKALIQGVELTLQSLLNILLKLGVKIKGQKNELFDSKIHTPIFVESSEKTLPNHIISIKKKGLTFNNILLRKAIVTIPKN